MSEIKVNVARSVSIMAQLAILGTQQTSTTGFSPDVGETPAALSNLAMEIASLDAEVSALIQETSSMLSNVLAQFAERDQMLAQQIQEGIGLVGALPHNGALPTLINFQTNE